MPIPASLQKGLALPVICAPMFIVSNPESPLSRDVNRLAQTLVGGATTDTEEKPNRRGIFARR